jgi:hypothetical protein
MDILGPGIGHCRDQGAPWTERRCFDLLLHAPEERGLLTSGLPEYKEGLIEVLSQVLLIRTKGFSYISQMAWREWKVHRGREE